MISQVIAMSIDPPGPIVNLTGAHQLLSAAMMPFGAKYGKTSCRNMVFRITCITSTLLTTTHRMIPPPNLITANILLFLDLSQTTIGRQQNMTADSVTAGVTSKRLTPIFGFTSDLRAPAKTIISMQFGSPKIL
jgi:hypothetical protein